MTGGGRRKRVGNRFLRAAEPPRPRLRPRLRSLARRSRPTLLALACAAALGGSARLGWRYVTASPRFSVRRLEIASPLRHATQAELRRRLPIAVGDNIFRADLPAAARALAEHPWVRAARIHRELPGTIAMEITEREPACVVLLGGLYLADRSGYVFKRATMAEADGLFVVTGLDRESYVDDQPAAQALIREALEAAERWRAGGRPALSEAAVSPMLGISLFLRDGGAEIRLGHGDLARKLERFDTLWRELAHRGERLRAVILDSVTRPDRVAVRLKPALEGG